MDDDDDDEEDDDDEDDDDEDDDDDDGDGDGDDGDADDEDDENDDEDVDTHHCDHIWHLRLVQPALKLGPDEKDFFCESGPPCLQQRRLESNYESVQLLDGRSQVN